MTIKSVWGFDPEEAIQAQQSFRARISQEVSYSLVYEEGAQIPPDTHSQIEELFRMFEL